MADGLSPPIEAQVLDRLRLAFRKRVPSAGLGAHLHRQRGQSLEFREYRDYTFGDDIRTVDWAASARKGRKWDLVAKSFEAEERRTLIILLDCRPAMRLPAAVPKLVVGAWLAQCLMQVALAEKDRVIFAPVFADKHSISPMRIDGPTGLQSIRAYVQRILDTDMTHEDWNAVPEAGIGGLRAVLKPAAAVVMISDALFQDTARVLAGFARAAQKSFRTFHMCEIDSWPHEQVLLGAMPFRLQGIAGRNTTEYLAETSESFLAETIIRLSDHRNTLRTTFSGPGMIWPETALTYPETADFNMAQAQSWFRNSFPEMLFLDSLLSRVG